MNHLNKKSVLPALILSMLLVYSCNKEIATTTQKNMPASYSSEVLDKWMTMQLRLMRNATGIPNHGFSRHFAYTGIAAMECLEPGLHGQAEWTKVWNGLTGLPEASHSKNYYYPANVNAAMAAMNKAMFPNASVADKAAIDSLEAALNQSFLLTEEAIVIANSVEHGKAVAAAVFNWAETDGYKNANSSYTVPVGPGLWKPTPPAFSAPATPYWGNNRPVVAGSTVNSQPVAPPAYAENEGSAFFNMVNEVYTVSLNLTNDQKAMAMFWRDVPGATSPGHWLSIVQQVIRQKESSLDKAALAYAVTGAAINDALISCFQAKYSINLVRPVTYIREVMGHTTWTPYLGTPATPEYSSAHSALSAAAGEVLDNLFHNFGTFTDRTYDYMGFSPRTYSSFSEIGQEAGQSRLFAGIHYKPSIDAGTWQGKKVAANIFLKHIQQYIPK